MFGTTRSVSISKSFFPAKREKEAAGGERETAQCYIYKTIHCPKDADAKQLLPVF
jgi:hypothetical protein